MAARRIKPRSALVVPLRRLGHKVKPSGKAYTRKGRKARNQKEEQQ